MNGYATFRVFGPALDREVGYEDVEITRVNLDGTMYFSPVDTKGKQWAFTAEELAGLRDRGFVIPLAETDGSRAEWDDVDRLIAQATEQDSDRLIEAARNVFQHITQ